MPERRLCRYYSGNSRIAEIRRKNVKKNFSRYLLISIIVAAVLSTAVLAGVTMFMKDKSESSISKIGEIYMAEMNRQIQQ